jgi:hypothetical protein
VVTWKELDELAEASSLCAHYREMARYDKGPSSFEVRELFVQSSIGSDIH